MVKTSYEIVTELRSRKRVFHSTGGLPSKDRIAPATELLIEKVNLRQGDRVLDYGCGYGAVGIALADAAPGLEVHMVDSDIRAVRFAQRNARANGAKNAHVVLDHTLNRFANGYFDVVALSAAPDSTNDAVFEMIERAQPKLRHGAMLYVGAKANRGAKGLMRRLTETVGPAKVVARANGDWLMRAERSPIIPPQDGGAPREHLIDEEIRGRKYRFRAGAGVFSSDRLDPGTRLLIETMEVRPAHSVIDVGCGYGAIGIVAAHLASVGRIVMVDCDARAFEYALANVRSHHLSHARKNGRPRVEVILGDRFDAVPGERFDRVLSHPPVHAGSDVLFPLVDDAYRHLRVHGRLYLAVVRYTAVRKHITKVFGNCRIASERGRHAVLVAERTA
jgi:16S rRNA (guanine1207-N2)-methyltransferase